MGNYNSDLLSQHKHGYNIKCIIPALSIVLLSVWVGGCETNQKDIEQLSSDTFKEVFYSKKFRIHQRLIYFRVVGNCCSRLNPLRTRCFFFIFYLYK